MFWFQLNSNNNKKSKQKETAQLKPLEMFDFYLNMPKINQFHFIFAMDRYGTQLSNKQFCYSFVLLLGCHCWHHRRTIYSIQTIYVIKYCTSREPRTEIVVCVIIICNFFSCRRWCCSCFLFSFWLLQTEMWTKYTFFRSSFFPLLLRLM